MLAPLTSTPARKPLALAVLALAAGMTGAACHSGPESAGPTAPVIVVNAPAAGVVRRVLVSEGAQVSAGTPIVEIAVQQTGGPAPGPTGASAETQAVNQVRASQAEIDSARAEVIRHQAEIQRLTPLVAAGQASQAELDGARALYDRAQQRLQQAQDAARQAQTGLLAAREPSRQPAPAVPREEIVAARATSAGTVAVINARVGDRVTSGQPLATLRGN